jgi:hypothetical protein
MEKASPHTGAGNLTCVMIAVPAGSSAPTPSSLRSIIRAARATNPGIASTPLADVVLVRHKGRAEVRLFFGRAEGEVTQEAK